MPQQRVVLFVASYGTKAKIMPNFIAPSDVFHIQLGLGLRASFLRFTGLRPNPQDVAAAIAEVVEFYNRLATDAANELKATVPVRTGLMRRSTTRRQKRGGRLAVVQETRISSVARNKRGVEYAPYVERYEQALKRVVAKTQKRIAAKIFRHKLLYFRVVVGRISHRAGVHMEAKKEGHVLVMRLSVLSIGSAFR